MNTIRILNVEPDGYCEDARAILSCLGTLTEKPMERSSLLKEIETYDVLITRLAHRIDDELLSRGKNLKAVVTATTGLDHVDLEAAARYGVRILSLKGETDFLETITATAEHTFALLLVVTRQIHTAHASVLAGKWDRDRFRGRELSGQRLGLVGLGRLGRMMAKYASVFGMLVAAFDPYAQNWPPYIRRCQSLIELAQIADVLSIHAALSDETTGMVNSEVIAALPAGVIVINTARGAILDEEALADALRSGHLAGAGLDVVCGENRSDQGTSALIELARHHPGVVVTPHIGGATRESLQKTEVFMAQRLNEFLAVSQ